MKIEKNLFLAYDGSINGDWVSRYAIRMAANIPDKSFTLLHIRDKLVPLEKVRDGVEAIEAESRTHGIEVKSRFVDLSRDVIRTLLHEIPPGKNNYCICGARIIPRGKGFLSGTISEQLLRLKRFNVLAIRVVNPGLLGCPGDLMFPLAGHPRGFKAAMPFLLMLAPNIRRIHILRVMGLNPFRRRYISIGAARTLVDHGMSYVSEIIEEIERNTAETPLQVDGAAVLADNWANEILVQANKVHARMILLGATERALPSRFFYGNRIEWLLSRTPCDFAIYRKT